MKVQTTTAIRTTTAKTYVLTIELDPGEASILYASLTLLHPSYNETLARDFLRALRTLETQPS